MKFLTIIFEFSIIADFSIINFSLSTNLLPSLKTPLDLTDEKTHLDSRSDQEPENVGDSVTDFTSLLNATNPSLQAQPNNFTILELPSDQEQESFDDDVTDFPLLLDETNHLPDVCDGWWSIRNYNMTYVDKTDILDYVIRRGRILNLCARPRRFGKSLFAQMASSYFSGQEDLFYGTKISQLRSGNIIHSEPNGSWIQYPIINLDFSAIHYKIHPTYIEIQNEFRREVKERLTAIADTYKVRHSGSISLANLIYKLKDKFKLPVIIIIDEYDNPINTAVFDKNNRILAAHLVEVINDLFAEIKGSIEYIRFVWITGVTRLPIPALHSSVNNYVDLTNHMQLTRVAGFTKSEIQRFFKSEIKSFAKVKNLKEKNIWESLQSYYDGYRFSTKRPEKVYNPISVIAALREMQISNFWTSTGSILYIVKKIAERHENVEDYDNLHFTETYLLKKYDIITNEIPLPMFMFQNGYLTVQNCQEENCLLKIPNAEIKMSLHDALVSFIPSEGKLMEEVEWVSNLVPALNNRNISGAIHIMNKIGFQYHHNPLNSDVNELEATRRIIAMFKSVGISCDESKTFFLGDPLHGKVAKGDVDISTKNLRINYAIEIKCGTGENQLLTIGLEQLLGYVTKENERRISFLEHLGNPNSIHLFTIHVNHISGGRIDEWVFIPYTGRKLILGEMQTSSEKLSADISHLIKTKIDSIHISDH